MEYREVSVKNNDTDEVWKEIAEKIAEKHLHYPK